MQSTLQDAKEEAAFRQYLLALLKHGDDDSVWNELIALEVPKPFKLRVKVLYSVISPLNIFDHLCERRLISKLSTDSSSYLYKTTVGRKHIREIELPFFVAPFADAEVSGRTQAVVSVCRADEWRAFQSFSRSQYPRLVPILLSQHELIRGARVLREKTGHDVHVKAYSVKEKLSESNGKGRQSFRGWTDLELDRALVDIQDRGQIITSIDIDFFPRVGDVPHVRPRASCTIRKDGEVLVTGSLEIAFESVAKQVAIVGDRKLSFLAGRGMRESKYIPRPLQILFRQPVFDDLVVVRDFVTILGKYPNSMHAIEHGNPYAHVKLTDWHDGSSFDVWALPPHRIALVPGLTASPAAFERIVHYIYDTFREGELGEFRQRPK